MERPWNIRGTSVERSWNAQGTGAWIPSPRKTDGRKMSVWENKTDRQNERSKEMNIRKVRVMLGILSPSLIRLGNERKIFNCSGYKMSEKDFFPWDHPMCRKMNGESHLELLLLSLFFFLFLPINLETKLGWCSF